MTINNDANLYAIREAIDDVLIKYNLPLEALSELWDIAALTAKWQAAGVLAKLVGVPEMPKTLMEDESLLN